MKASMKFREDQTPILRAKVPLKILGFPFQSGIVAGDTKDFCLTVGTLFDSGPLLKLAYRPNDSWRPFSFSAPDRDFSIKRSVDSHIALRTRSSISTPKFKSHVNDGDSENEEFFENNETPVKARSNQTANGVVSSKIMRGFPAASAVERLFSDVEVFARTALPLRDRAVLKLRWSVRLPANEGTKLTADNWCRKIPSLVLSKIRIEHVCVNAKQGHERKLNKNSEVVEACLAVKRELDILQAESGLLRNGLDELRSEIGTGKSSPATGVKVSGRSNEFEKNGGKQQNKESKSFPDRDTTTNPHV
ncbi:hypothetical protein F0562_018665 [Nyssa sinensis]|uniref:Uncharacterized protein n=1 Tax=Nyssa sinensis TaxID=561372 RepID=A0A5J4ZD67_9ASTE|nr:hypothetical protein F0562_018665 [Nyssa sinensis]